LQGILVGKILTKADVEQCRVVLPRMAMEANMPEVVDANLLHVVSLVILLSCFSCCLAYEHAVVACFMLCICLVIIVSLKQCWSPLACVDVQLFLSNWGSQ